MPELTPVEATKTTAATETKAVKPGWKTTEGWFTLAANLIGLAYMMGLISPDGPSPVAKAVAFIAVALTNAGYAVSRGMAKKS